MRIGIEAQRIFREKKHGMDFVALELIRAFQQIDSTNEYFIFVKPDVDCRIIKPAPNFHVVEVKGNKYPLWEQRHLPKAVRNAGVDILHCTSSTAPVKLDIPVILSLHDLAYLENMHLKKGTSYQWMGNLYRRWLIPRMIPACDRIITVSDYENTSIREKFNLSEEKVTTTYNAAGPYFQRITNGVRLGAIKEKYQLPDEFIFFLGNTDPKKNVSNVLRALALLKQRGQLNMPLVMLDYDAENLQRQLREIGATELWDDVLLCGYVPHHELPCLYNLATVFLYPSLRESFGIPMLEAMACGTPVITSNTAAMPEVAGKAALYVDPTNPEEIAQTIHRVVSDQALYQELMQKGGERAALFSWKATAERTLKIYEEVIGRTSKKPVGSKKQLEAV